MSPRPLWALLLSWQPFVRGRLDDGRALFQLSVHHAQELPLSGSASKPAWLGDQGNEWRSLVNEDFLRKELRSASQPAAPGTSDRLLVFWPVGGSEATRDLVVENINQLKKFTDHRLPRPLRVNVFLVHYDGHRDAWRKAVGPKWYDAHVRYSLEYQGLKIWMAKDILLSKLNGSSRELNSYQINVDSYAYVWMVDEDADFSHVDLRLLVDLAHESGSGIVTPAFTTRGSTGFYGMRQSSETGEIGNAGVVGEVGQGVESGSGGESRSADGGLMRCQFNDTLCVFQAPRSQCRFRYVGVVEVSFALVKPAVFRGVAEGCPGCLPDRQSIWGLDRVWCALAAWDSSGPMRSCAILDATPIVHQNRKTLPAYEDWPAYYDYHDLCGRVMHKVRSSLRSLWREPDETEAECIPAGSGAIE